LQQGQHPSGCAAATSAVPTHYEVPATIGLWIKENLSRVALLQHFSQVEECHALCNTGGLLQIVGDDNDGMSPVGDRVLYDDGKLEGVVESTVAGEAIVRVTKAKANGANLKPEKGINLPDTALGLSPLTAKDERDLTTVISCADIIGYSFVSRPQDLDILEEALSRHEATGRRLGLIAKIETPEAVKNLPALIARASGRRAFGVMIARGDLAAEIGFERLAEMQEEILWICEAASTPAIWATQVLENLVSTGVPSRGEMTDAAMAARAECVMLNKGPAIGTAVELLDRLLARMDSHLHKKTPMLRELRSW
jgi:pyruvate kinase